MPFIDIVIIILAVGTLVGVVAWSIRNKKKGKTSCGCDCSKCSGCSSCKETPKK
ncbi:MAG: FeoB-associated Cys-rich membrane protein [Clostridia bacterium]|nr:FeoB-associated Cys-rich membrane protein [Clostridia bacterium]